MENALVSVTACPDYDPARVEAAMDALLEPLGGLSWVTPGLRVLIKVNLVAARKPEAAATTHPALVSALCRRLADRGAQVTVGDSPGGLFTPAFLKMVYNAAGMAAVEAAGAVLNYDTAQKSGRFPAARVLKDFDYTVYIDRADAVISFGKLKTHGMMGMTGAVKNLFGIIPGAKKPEYHFLYPDTMQFAHMLVDICEFVRPRLSIIDGVVGMEGNGPTAGTPRQMGVLLASENPYCLDLAAAALMGVAQAPTLQAAHERGLAPECAGELRLSQPLEPFVAADYQRIPVKSVEFFSRQGIFSDRLLSWALGRRPQLHPALCVSCGECARVCPAGAIAMGAKPKFDYTACIRCFCCQEFCPKSAIVVHRGVITRLLR